MTTQQLEEMLWIGLPYIIALAIGAIAVLLIKGSNRSGQCPTPDASIMKALEKRLAHLVSTAQTKEYFLKEAEKLWDARELLTPKK